MVVYVVRKWPLQGRSRFVCWNITRVILWLLCNVHFVRSQRPGYSSYNCHVTSLTLKARIIAAVKNIDAPMLTRVCGKNLNIVSMCAVSPVVHTSNIFRCQQKIQTVSVCPLVFLL